MKILSMILLSVLTLFNPTPKAEEFMENVTNGYKEFQVIYEKTAEDYQYIVVQGQVEDMDSFSIFLSTNEIECDIKITYENYNYYAVSDDKTQYLVYNIGYDSLEMGDIVISVEGLDDIEKVYLPQAITQSTQGLNQGIEPSSLTREADPLLAKVRTIMVIIIIVSVVALIILMVFKVGMFNKEKRKANIPDLSEQFKEFYRMRAAEEEEIMEVTGEEIIDTPVDEEPKEVYEKMIKYDEDEEIANVEELLKAKGLNTDYEHLNEEEKNRVMLELMYLKHVGKITQQQYQKETVKLWKK